jgi:biopolymer transport protein ExbD
MAGGVITNENDFNAEPNVIPLVDIMLVLMIIFIITIPVMTHAVKIDLPRATNKPNVTKPENINVSIDFDGQVYWNETAVGGEELLQNILGRPSSSRSRKCTSAPTSALATSTWRPSCSRCSAVA